MIQQPKILCLFSTPLVTPDGKPVEALDIKDERDAIVRELAAYNREILIRIGIATTDELDLGITDGFNILHLSCHGNQDFLLFEDGRGGSHPVKGDYLERLIGAGGPFELAIVSACHSEKIGEMLNDAGIRHVVAIKCDVPVLDYAAIAFAGQFYRNIIRGGSIQKSFEMAKLLVEGNSKLTKIKPQLELMASKEGEPFVPEEDKFVLLPKNDPSRHLDPLISKGILHGELSIDETKRSKMNLPNRPQSFTGRSIEMHAIINELLANRLLTLTGTGGIGKTTLAVEVARWFHSRGHFRDGVFQVDLRQTETASGIIAMLGATLEAPLAETKDIIEFLKDRQCLLLLDNLEEILWDDEDAIQDLINEILKFCPNIKLLVTSQREVGGNLHEPEKIYRIYPMEKGLDANLFLATTKRNMTKPERESDSFRDLLGQLGGHPLSIVLMARQLVSGTTIEDLIERIRKYKADAIKVKTIMDRDPEHGESLIASLASTYDNLSDNAKTVFGILFMLPAGAQEFTVNQIFGDKGWEYVQELHDASLAEITSFRHVFLLQPVRLFAISILKDEIKEQYGPKIVEVMAGYAMVSYGHLGAKDAKGYRQFFTLEEPNLRFAIELPCSAPDTNKEVSALGLLAPHLLSLYNAQHRHHEAKDVGNAIIPILEKLKDKLGEANTLDALGDLAVRTNDLEDARKRYDKALDIYQEIDAKLGEANTLLALGDLAVRTNDLEDSKKRYDKALDIYQENDEKIGEANTLEALGDLAVRTNDLEDAKKRYDKALDIYQEIDAKLGEANTLLALGDLAVRTNDLEDSRKRYDKALDIFQENDEKIGEANTLLALGDLAVRTDDLEDARKRYDKALDIYQEIDEKIGEANTLWALGNLAVRTNDLEDSKKRYDKALDIYQEINAKLGEANTLMRLGQWFTFKDALDRADNNLDDAFKIFRDIKDLEGQADIHMIRGLLLLKRHDNTNAKKELDQCLSIRDKILGHGEAAQWLVFYADHLKLQGLDEGSKICLEYAREFTSKV